MQFRPGVGERNPRSAKGWLALTVPGVYVNAEPMMKRYIECNFNGNMKGNLYEIEHHDDFVAERLDFIGVESLSEVREQGRPEFRRADVSPPTGWLGRPRCSIWISSSSSRRWSYPEAPGRVWRQHEQHVPTST